MFHIALYQPEIPPNTGNLIRLSTNIGFQLHLIRPLGFVLDDKRLRRAGLDYFDVQKMNVHDSFEDFLTVVSGRRVFLCETYGKQGYHEVAYTSGDAVVFGSETRGLPDSLLERWPKECCIRLPMQKVCRSMNLSNCVSVVAYEVWHQLGFKGASLW